MIADKLWATMALLQNSTHTHKIHSPISWLFDTGEEVIKVAMKAILMGLSHKVSIEIIQGVPTSFGWKAFGENLKSARN